MTGTPNSPYGENDQLGSLNEITPQKIIAAARLVRTGKVFDLGRILDADVPRFPGRFYQQILVSTSHLKNPRDQRGNPEGLGENALNWITESVSGTYQIGTHLDALNHLQRGDTFYNGFRAADIVEEWGTNRLGIETVPPVITRGILVDIAGLKKKERLEAGYVITRRDIDEALDGSGISAERGDAIVFHTGWGKLWTENREEYSSAEPGPGLDAAAWMVEHGIAMAGCDTWSFGPVPPENPNRPFEVPQTLNVDHGMFIMENLDTEELAASPVREFMFALTHAKPKGATAASIAPAAII